MINTAFADSDDDLNSILSGTGRAVCGGQEEEGKAGVMHICPQGHKHRIRNTGKDDLVMLAIVVKR